MKESVKTFCRINGVEASESLAETLFEAYMESVANDEELKIFRLRAKGMSVLQISFAMQTETELYGTEKVERRIRAIKDKIAAAIE